MKIFISAKLTENAIDLLRTRAELVFGGWGHTGKKLTPAELIVQAAGCEVLIICYEEINDEVLDNLPEARLIACTRGGAENVDREAIKRHPDVFVTNAPGRNANAVAEYTMGLMLSAARHISKTHHYIMSQDWDRVPWDVKGRAAKKTFEGFELDGKTLGLIGFGAIGRAVARLSQAFGMKILVCDPYIKQEEQPEIELVSMEALLARADVVSLHVKVTEETRGMINGDVLRRMKPNAIFVNTARGVLVNESDLYQALRERVIACAALDVQANEPMEKDSPLLTLDNIILTPHLGGATSDILYQQTKIIMEDVVGYLDGGRPVHVIG